MSRRLLRAREGFYRELFVLVLPSVLQNLSTSSVNMADVVMLGRVDQTSLSASSLAGQVMFLQADISKLKKDTGFSPAVPFEEGIRRTAQWYRERYL